MSGLRRPVRVLIIKNALASLLVICRAVASIAELKSSKAGSSSFLAARVRRIPNSVGLPLLAFS